MELLQQYLVPWLISNSSAILILILANWRPRISRLLFVILFAWACWINYTTANNSPEDYLEYAALTPFDSMREFIMGWFKENMSTMVSTIAIGQGLIALGFLLKGIWVRIAGVGAIIFLLAILPLGIGSGFPATIFAAFAVLIILKRDRLDYLWKFSGKNTNNHSG